MYSCYIDCSSAAASNAALFETQESLPFIHFGCEQYGTVLDTGKPAFPYSVAANSTARTQIRRSYPSWPHLSRPWRGERRGVARMIGECGCVGVLVCICVGVWLSGVCVCVCGGV